jgi:dimethylargininase
MLPIECYLRNQQAALDCSSIIVVMSLIAITREVSPSINECELSFHGREPIDVPNAIAQHKAYQDCLAELGARIVSLPAEPNLPDAVFVEDTAVVLDEVAIIANMGASSRRPETASVAEALGRYRPLKFLSGPATLDGGDVLRIGRAIFVGGSGRTNEQAIEQLRELCGGYDVRSIEVKGCLHLKSACSYIGNNTMLVHRPSMGMEQMSGFELLDVAADEPAAANVLLLEDTLIMPTSFPRTRVLLEERGFCVRSIDVSELQKAEAGVTCCSLIFTHREEG